MMVIMIGTMASCIPYSDDGHSRYDESWPGTRVPFVSTLLPT